MSSTMELLTLKQKRDETDIVFQSLFKHKTDACYYQKGLWAFPFSINEPHWLAWSAKGDQNFKLI